MNGLTAKRLAIALIASLALNLFLAGMYTAQWLGQRAESAERHGPPRHVRQGLEALDEDARKTVEAVFARHAEGLRAAYRASRESRSAIRAHFEAERFDRAATEAALAAYAETRARARAESNAFMLEIAAALSAEDRRLFFQNVRPKHLLRRSDGSRGEPGKPPPE